MGLEYPIPVSTRLGVLLDGLAVDQNLRGLGLIARVAGSDLRDVGPGGDGSRLLLLGLLFLFVLVFASLVLGDAVEDVVLQDAEDQEQPEEVDSLETREQGKGDVLTDPALVLLRFPVQFERSNGPELGQHGPEDLQVQVVAEVDPHHDEESEVGNGDEMVKVVESFGGLMRISSC